MKKIILLFQYVYRGDTMIRAKIEISSEGKISVTTEDVSGKSHRKIREHKGKSIIDFPSNYVVVDIETTGLDTSYDEIIELSAIQVIDNIQVDCFNSLVKPMDLIDDFITNLTGITNDMVSKAPNIKDILPQFQKFIGDSIIVGQNVNFDINFIYDNLINCSDKVLDNKFIDLLRISRKALPELANHKLGTVANYFNIDTAGSHRGMKDCTITKECFLDCKDKAIQKFGSIEDFIKLFNDHAISKDIKATTNLLNENHLLFNQVCVFTGTLGNMIRKDAMQAVVNVGGKCNDGLTKRTNYLIVGSLEYCSTIKGNKSSKIIKAEKYILEGQDIKIISENTFIDLFTE